MDTDIVVRKNSHNWKSSGLAVDSVIRLHKMVTIPKSLIKRRLGNINDALEKEIQLKILELFEIHK